MSLSHIIIRFSVCVHYSVVRVCCRVTKGANVLFSLDCVNSLYFTLLYLHSSIVSPLVNNHKTREGNCFIRILADWRVDSSLKHTQIYRSNISSCSNHSCRALSLMLRVASRQASEDNFTRDKESPK